MHGEHKLFPGRSYSFLSNFIVLQMRVSCAAADAHEFPLELLVSKTHCSQQLHSCLPRDSAAHPVTSVPIPAEPHYREAEVLK